MAKYQVVNENGLKEIRSILAARHKLGGDYFGPAELGAWAADVEFQLSEGNGAGFEIHARDTVSGHAEVHTLSPESIDTMGLEDEDE